MPHRDRREEGDWDQSTGGGGRARADRAPAIAFGATFTSLLVGGENTSEVSAKKKVGKLKLKKKEYSKKTNIIIKLPAICVRSPQLHRDRWLKTPAMLIARKSPFFLGT